MSKVRLNFSIDVTKIDKARLFKGEKGTYLNGSVLIDEEADQYGNNGMITQAVSEDERKAGVKGAILGNGKIVWRGDSQGVPNDSQQAPPVPQQGEDIPF